MSLSEEADKRIIMTGWRSFGASGFGEEPAQS